MSIKFNLLLFNNIVIYSSGLYVCLFQPAHLSSLILHFSVFNCDGLLGPFANGLPDEEVRWENEDCTHSSYNQRHAHKEVTIEFNVVH